MSRDIGQSVVWPDREQQQRERERGRLLITSCPPGLIRNGPDVSNRSSECLIAALIKQDRLVAAQTFSAHSQSRIGAVYLGKVKKIVKNLNACFVEISGHEQCFLHMDELEKAPPFLIGRVYDGRLLEGDELPVQLEKEAIKTKQATVTTRITLQGEYFVFTVGAARVGISRKLDQSRHKLLRKLLEDWQITDESGALMQEEGVPPFGMVVRTQAGQFLEQEQYGESALRREYEELRRRFTTLFQQGVHRTCYSCLLEAGTALEETLKSFQPGEYEEMVTDLPQMYEELLQLQQRRRLSTEGLRLYQDPDFTLDKLYGLETKLEEALHRTVWLKSGANLVIEQTESLTAIDVNTGKCTKLTGDRTPEDTMRRVNLEAAREVVRQLRLRNLSGIIIVDFINLSTLAQEEELLQELRELAREDPVTVQVVDMTPLGLVEITRRKIFPSLREQFGLTGERI